MGIKGSEIDYNYANQQAKMLNLCLCVDDTTFFKFISCPGVVNFLGVFWGKNEKCLELPEIARKLINKFAAKFPLVSMGA